MAHPDGMNESSMNNTDEMFSGETDKNSMAVINEMSELICYEDAACALAKSELTDRQDKLKSLKIKLYDEMLEAGFQNVKLDNGLAPSRSLVTKYFKAAGVDNDDLFDWLRGDTLSIRIVVDVLYENDIPINQYTHLLYIPDEVNTETMCETWFWLEAMFKAAGPGLGDIIKPTVHHGTLNSALKSYVEQGNEVSDTLINAVLEKGIRMNGKSKFLAMKALAATTAE